VNGRVVPPAPFTAAEERTTIDLLTGLLADRTGRPADDYQLALTAAALAAVLFTASVRCDGRVRPVGGHPGQHKPQAMGLPSPVIRSSPAQAALQLSNLPTWLWISPAEGVPKSKTATVPGES
jgi:hypothetical protein